MESNSFSSSELFDSYEEDFCNYFENSKKALDGYNSLSIEEKQAKFDKAQRYYQDAHKCLRHMEVEITTMPPSFKAPLNQRVKACRNKYDLLTTQILKLKDMLELEAQRSDLFKHRTQPRGKGRDDDVTQRLLRTGDQNLDTCAQLGEMNQLAHETHATALAIHGTLVRDGEVLNKTSTKTRNVDQELGLSHTLMNSIIRREFTDKALLCAIAFLLFILDCSVFYYKVLM